MSTPLLGTTTRADTTNGGEGFAREEKAELFVAAVSTFSNKGGGGDNTERVRELTRKVTLEDPAWVMRFDRWLRDEANIRSLTIEVACTFVKTRLDEGVPDELEFYKPKPGEQKPPSMNRVVINVACQRADEPSLLLDYWVEHYGRSIPAPVKRGVGDAAVRLWNEYGALKYDTPSLNWRFADVLELCHPKAQDDKQRALFEWLLNRRHGVKDSTEVLKELPMATANTHLRSLLDSEVSKRMLRENLLAEPETLKEAGWTWENLAGLGPMDGAAWDAIIPQMGIMALIRNLRNFDSAGISDRSFEFVASRIGDEAAIRKSRVFPFRFYSAFKAAQPRWAPALETAVKASVSNIPDLKGRTLIMVDCSGSMFYSAHDRSEMQRYEQAGLFASAVAARCEDAVLVKYGTNSELVTPDKAGVLATMKQFTGMGGTETTRAVDIWLTKVGPVDRVLVITDEQTSRYERTLDKVVPKETMLYTWNIGGYVAAHTSASPTRHTFAGLTDQAFKMIPLIEAGHTYDWPF